MLKDIRVAWRGLRRAPGFAVAAILTLALAIGMATSIFSVVNAVLLRPLPYRDAERLAVVWGVNRSSARSPVSYDDFADWLRASQTLESGALYTSFYRPIFTGAGQAERLTALLVSHQYFTVLGAAPAAGRFFVPAEDRDGSDDVVVLSNAFWRSRFDSDPQVVGRTIRLNARPHVIVGVAGPGLAPLPRSLAGEPPQIYRPVGEPFDAGSRTGRHLRAIVRLRPGVTTEQAQAELTARCREMERVNPEADRALAASIVNLHDDITRPVRPGLVAVEGAVLVLLLIACANIANLLLVKSTGRRREIAIRAALGAGRTRLAGMLLTESLVLGAAGGVCGLLLAWWATAGLTVAAESVLPDAGQVLIDGRVLLFSAAVSIGAAVLFGMAPVFRLNAANLEEAVHFGNRLMGDRRNRLRQTLAAGQIALALMLLATAGLLGRSFARLRAVDPGFKPDGVLTAALSIPTARYPAEPDAAAFYQRLLTRVRSLPRVRRAAIASVVPMSGNFDRTSFEIAGRSMPPGEALSPDRYIVDPDYFQLMGIPLRQGRLFDARDAADREPVCIVSETAARQWFPGESPIGKKVRAGSTTGFARSPFREVVGVVGDVAQYGLGLVPTPQIYMPHQQYVTRFMSLLVSAEGDPSDLASPLQAAVFAIDREQPLHDVRGLEAIVSDSVATRRLGLWLLAVFAGGALLLAATGIYGVVSNTVAQRTPEYGVRIALGAQPGDIVRSALAGAMAMIGAGLAAGIAGSIAASRLVGRFLFGIEATDAVTFGTVSVVLAVFALAACYLPARHAANVDPITALRHE